jgi:nucleotide-binding universal stress UspA family protein
MPLQHILLCTDFSLASEGATLEAIDLCKRTGANLLVLHINEYGDPPHSSRNPAAYIPQQCLATEQSIKDLVDRVHNEHIVADAFTVTGHPPVSIVEFIAEHRPDIAIVGTNGIKGLERMIFGSTAESVFRHATCPVMVVGPRVSNKRQNGSGPVVFATDFHEPAPLAFRHALALAQAKAVPLHCIHILPLTAENEEHRNVLISIMTEALRRIAKDVPPDSCNITHDVIFDSEVSHAVVSYAEKHNADSIVLGVHRGPVLSSHLPPHLTYRIIVTAQCPVLAVSTAAARAAAHKPMTFYDS